MYFLFKMGPCKTPNASDGRPPKILHAWCQSTSFSSSSKSSVGRAVGGDNRHQSRKKDDEDGNLVFPLGSSEAGWNRLPDAEELGALRHLDVSSSSSSSRSIKISFSPSAAVIRNTRREGGGQEGGRQALLPPSPRGRGNLAIGSADISIAGTRSEGGREGRQERCKKKQRRGGGGGG